MTKTLSNEIDSLRSMDLPALRKRFLAVMGRPTNSVDRDSLITKIGERLLLGGPSRTARAGGATLAASPDAGGRNGAHTKTSPRHPGRPISREPVSAPALAATKAKRPASPSQSPFAQDPRLPKPGSTITKEWRGKRLEVKVFADHFEFRGKPYRSLSRIACDLVGGSVNGFRFFGLTSDRKAAPSEAPSPRAAKTALAKRSTKTRSRR